MFEGFFEIMLVCSLAVFGALALSLGGAVTVVVGLGWVRLTFRSRGRTKPTEGQGEPADASR